MECMRALAVMILLLETGLANIDIRRGGWLHRVVQYHKGKFINEIKQLAPLQIKAKIIPAPQDYKDSKHWNFESVLHLMVLIRGSESAAPVYRRLRRMLTPTRRIMMSMKDSFKHFPSLANNCFHNNVSINPDLQSSESLNNMYYDFDMDNYEDEPTFVNGTDLGDNEVIVITNPVEARLPSALISVKLLKDILIQRAIAARSMPITIRSTIPWKPIKPNKNKNSGDDKKEEGDNKEGDNKGETQEKEPSGTGGTTTEAAGTGTTAGGIPTTTEVDTPAP